MLAKAGYGAASRLCWQLTAYRAAATVYPRVALPAQIPRAGFPGPLAENSQRCRADYQTHGSRRLPSVSRAARLAAPRRVRRLWQCTTPCNSAGRPSTVLNALRQKTKSALSSPRRAWRAYTVDPPQGRSTSEGWRALNMGSAAGLACGWASRWGGGWSRACASPSATASRRRCSTVAREQSHSRAQSGSSSAIARN